MMNPLFVVGPALVSLFKTVGDPTTLVSGFASREKWKSIVNRTGKVAEVVAVAVGAIEPGTSITSLSDAPLAPPAIGLFSASPVDGVGIPLLAPQN